MIRFIVICLISFLITPAFGEEIPKYERKYFKHWIDADKDGQDTREEVIEDETINDHLTCIWTGGVFPASGEGMDNDHQVPLKKAWYDGAWRWDEDKRTEYANYLGDPDHLQMIDLSANRSKGARGPCDWLPKLHRCKYAISWIRVKRNPYWDLEIDPKEAACLMDIIAAECPAQLY